MLKQACAFLFTTHGGSFGCLVRVVNWRALWKPRTDRQRGIEPVLVRGSGTLATAPPSERESGGGSQTDPHLIGLFSHNPNSGLCLTLHPGAQENVLKRPPRSTASHGN